MSELPKQLPPEESGQRLEIVRHLHTLAVQRYLSRRSVEFQFAFTLWLLVAAFGVALREVTDVPTWVGIAIAGAAVLLHAWFQRRYVYVPGKKDWEMGHDFDTELRKAADLTEAPRNYGSEYQRAAAHAWQVAVTAIVGIIVTYSLLAS